MNLAILETLVAQGLATQAIQVILAQGAIVLVIVETVVAVPPAIAETLVVLLDMDVFLIIAVTVATLVKAVILAVIAVTLVSLVKVATHLGGKKYLSGR